MNANNENNNYNDNNILLSLFKTDLKLHKKVRTW